MKLLVSINDIDHSITNQIQNIRVHNYLQPVLLFNWDLKFVNKLTNQTYPLPLQLSLTWIQARTLRQILQNQFTVQLLHETNIHLKEFNFQVRNAENTEIPLDKQISLPSKMNIAASCNEIYPTLPSAT